MKTAIVYDWIDKEGGIERVLPVIFGNFKNADIFTSYYDKDRARWAKNFNIKITFLQNFPNFIKKSRLLSFIFYPYAFESLKLDDYDLVISITSSFSKSVITKPETLHICYMLTPTRYFWIDETSYFKNPFIKIIGKLLINSFKKWDYVAAQRPDYIFSISKLVKQRVKKFYNRDSQIIYPCFDIDYWNKIKKTLQDNNPSYKKYYLLVSRLEPYKKVDIAIEAFNKLNKNLIIVGTGTLLNKLKKIAKKNIEFKQNISDKELAVLYSSAEALIMPQSEEFGLVALESQFFGCPIISFYKSGSAETTIDNKTAIFFNKQNGDSLAKAVVRFESISYNLKTSAKKLNFEYFLRFDKKIFINKIDEYIKSLILK
jgi:glycosyltransferase involved in cell wall biosynthesis